MIVKDIEVLKHLLLKEEEVETLPQGFEDDPMGFILKKYPGLNTVMEYMMTKDFREYVDAVFVVAPKPTTFKIVLHNGQYFFLQFMGKAYQATVLGKNYYLMTVGEKERCMLAIARLLRYGSPLKTKGPEGAEQGTAGAEAGGETGGGETGGGAEAGGETAAAPETGGGEEEETPVTESMILEGILKKTLFEEDDSSEVYSSTLRASELGKKPKKAGFDSIGRLIYYLIDKKEGILVSDDKTDLENAYKVTLDFEKEYGPKFYNQDYKGIKDDDLIFVDSKNASKKYSVSNIVKTKDFGGAVKGAISKYEFPVAKSLQSQIDEIKKEKKISGVKISVGGETYDDISIVKVNESQKEESDSKLPKADLILSNSNGEEKIFISHKKKTTKEGGKGAAAFIAWTAVASSEGGVEKGSEIDAFGKALKSLAEKKLGLDWKYMFVTEETKNNYYTSISDDLKLKSVYGKDFGTDDFGINNVQLVVQGDLSLKQIANSDEYELDGYEQAWVGGKNPDVPSGEYEPFLVARFSKRTNAFGFKKCVCYITGKKNLPKGSEFVNTSYDSSSDQIVKSKKKTKIGTIPIPSEAAIRIVDKGKSVILVRNSWIDNQLPKYFRGNTEKEKKLKVYKKYFLSNDTGYGRGFSVLDPKSVNKFEIQAPELKQSSVISAAKKSD